MGIIPTIEAVVVIVMKVEAVVVVVVDIVAVVFIVVVVEVNVILKMKEAVVIENACRSLLLLLLRPLAQLLADKAKLVKMLLTRIGWQSFVELFWNA